MTRSDAQCFHLLGLSGLETVSEVRRAYRQIAKRLHPDRVGGNAEKFKEITAAYNHILHGIGQSKKNPSNKRAQRNVRQAQWGSSSRPGKRNANVGARRASWRKAQPQPQKRNRRYAEESGTENFGPGERRKRNNYATYDRAGCSENKTTESKSTQSQSVKSSPQQTAHSASRFNTSNSTHGRPSTQPSTPPVDANIEAAWKEWCEKTRNYEDLVTRRDQSETIEPKPQCDEVETPKTSRGPGIRGWLKRGIDRLGFRSRTDLSGSDTHLRLQLAPHLVVFGGSQRIAVRRDVRCPSCRIDTTTQCVCGGAGRIKIREVITVHVEPGAIAGAQIRVAGKGTESLDKGFDGDLILCLEPRPVCGFRRDGVDLHGQLQVTPMQLQSGGLVDVSLPRGVVKLKVPPRTRAGDRFRLRKQGLDEWRGDGRGDVYLTVREG